MTKNTYGKLAIILLLGVLVSMIFFQWKSFSSEQQKRKVMTAIEEISIKHENNRFIVQQTIKHLVPNTYDVTWPEDVKNVKCLTKDTIQCNWLNKSKSKIKLKNSQVTISYTLNRPTMQTFVLLKNWFVRFNNIKIESSKIQLSEGQFQNGMWIAGGKRVALKQLDYIDYYVFESEGDVPPLLWEKEDLSKIDTNSWLTIYHNLPTKVSPTDLGNINKLTHIPPIAVAITNEHPTEQVGSLIILNKADQQKLEDFLVQAIVSERYRFAKGEEWYKDIISSAIIGKPMGTSKAQNMYKQLKHTLGKKAMEEWTNQVIFSNRYFMDENYLDSVIQKVTGFKSDFFNSNKKESSSIIVLKLFDPRKLIVNGNASKDLSIISIKGKRLYPLVRTMRALGFNVKSTSNTTSMIIEKPNHRYQFDWDSPIFIYNNEKYGLLSSPVIKMEGEYFVDENWLKQLFKINITSDTKNIELSDS
jgi:hypothetical protein